MKKIISLVLILFFAGRLFSQDTLPRFTLSERANKVTISWTNPFQSLIQLNVQRSYDSLRNFSTVFSAPSPELQQNGFTDTRPATNRVFYRIFYVLEGGAYFFSKSKRVNGSPDGTTSVSSGDNPDARDMTNGTFGNIVAGDKRMVTIQIRNEVYRQVSVNAFRNFRDSILHLTKDTLYAINDTLVAVNPYLGHEAFKVSSYIYVSKDGFINVSVPAIGDKKYNIKFFEEDGTPLFEIHYVKESPLILDKANFVHSGWFGFELYEDNKLKEKNKFYVPKDF